MNVMTHATTEEQNTHCSTAEAQAPRRRSQSRTIATAIRGKRGLHDRGAKDALCESGWISRWESNRQGRWRHKSHTTEAEGMRKSGMNI